jgi:hypothetical protein
LPVASVYLMLIPRAFGSAVHLTSAPPAQRLSTFDVDHVSRSRLAFGVTKDLLLGVELPLLRKAEAPRTAAAADDRAAGTSTNPPVPPVTAVRPAPAAPSATPLPISTTPVAMFAVPLPAKKSESLVGIPATMSIAKPGRRDRFERPVCHTSEAEAEAHIPRVARSQTVGILRDDGIVPGGRVQTEVPRMIDTGIHLAAHVAAQNGIRPNPRHGPRVVVAGTGV